MMRGGDQEIGADSIHDGGNPLDHALSLFHVTCGRGAAQELGKTRVRPFDVFVSPQVLNRYVNRVQVRPEHAAERLSPLHSRRRAFRQVMSDRDGPDCEIGRDVTIGEKWKAAVVHEHARGVSDVSFRRPKAGLPHDNEIGVPLLRGGNDPVKRDSVDEGVLDVVSVVGELPATASRQLFDDLFFACIEAAHAGKREQILRCECIELGRAVDIHAE